MHLVIVNSTNKEGEKVQSALLQDSFYEDGELKTRTIAKFMDCTEEEISAIQFALKHKEKLQQIDFETLEVSNSPQKHSLFKPQKILQGSPFGAVWALSKLCKRWGISSALQKASPDKSALFHLIMNTIQPTSSLLSLPTTTAATTYYLLKIKEKISKQATEDMLLTLASQQDSIEKRLFSSHIFSQKLRKQKPNLYYYPITNQYFKKEENLLEPFHPSLQRNISLGLLCDPVGDPLSLLLTEDSSNEQLDKDLKEATKKFEGHKTVVVLHTPPTSSPPFSYICPVTDTTKKEFLKNQILNKEIEEGDTFKSKEGTSFIVRRHTTREKEITALRLEKQKNIEKLVEEKNNQLPSLSQEEKEQHLKEVQQQIERVSAHYWMSVALENNQITLLFDQTKLLEQIKLEGFSILETNLEQNDFAPKEMIERYISIKKIESSFHGDSRFFEALSTSKIQENQMIKGHAFLQLLSFFIAQNIEKISTPFQLTPDDVLQQLSTICSIDIDGEIYFPAPKPSLQELLKALDLNLPQKMP